MNIQQYPKCSNIQTSLQSAALPGEAGPPPHVRTPNSGLRHSAIPAPPPVQPTNAAGPAPAHAPYPPLPPPRIFTKRSEPGEPARCDPAAASQAGAVRGLLYMNRACACTSRHHSSRVQACRSSVPHFNPDPCALFARKGQKRSAVPVVRQPAAGQRSKYRGWPGAPASRGPKAVHGNRSGAESPSWTCAQSLLFPITLQTTTFKLSSV